MLSLMILMIRNTYINDAMKKQWQLGRNILCWKAILQSQWWLWYGEERMMTAKKWMWNCTSPLQNICTDHRQSAPRWPELWKASLLVCIRGTPDHQPKPQICHWMIFSKSKSQLLRQVPWPKICALSVNRAISYVFLCRNDIGTATKACWIKEIHPSHKLKIKKLGVFVGKLWKNCIKKLETLAFHNWFHRCSAG